MASILPGDPAPWFEAPTTTTPSMAFSQLAGRWVVLCFHGSVRDAATRAMIEAIGAREDLIDDVHVTFGGVVAEPADLESCAALARPGVRFFDDRDGRIARLYGVTRPQTLVIDRGLRLVASIALDDPAAHAGRLLGALARLPRTPPPARAGSWAPVLLVPMVFEPAFCRALIGYFNTHASAESGFMRQDAEGRTTTAHDSTVKRRRDCPIEDPALVEGIRGRLVRRLFPEIRKAFGFEATRIERFGVVLYDAETGGYFRQHRDSTTPGTAHRRFATTINLNAEEYEGGDLHFPEYDHRVYRAPSGGAIVFSGAVLHEALPVTRGRRYACVPFLYDEAGAALRVKNAALHAEPELQAMAAADRA